MPQSLTISPGTKVQLKDFDPAFHGKYDKQQAIEEARRNIDAIGPLAERLYAESKRAVLLILQGMDAAGKDGTIRHVLDSVNPQSCQVVPFKAPNSEELAHDFLWRIHRAVPAKGNIGIFNRSQYEDVLIVRVHNLAPEDVWSQRYEAINAFEKLLADNGTAVIKVFLHISRDEQRERLQARIDDPEKRWKFNPQDLEERKLWSAYQQAYEDALTKCNTAHAPWHIVPADRKWYRNLIVSRLLLEKLQEMNPQFPQAKQDVAGMRVE